MHRRERAFGPHDEFDEIEFSVSNKFIKVVSTDASHDLWISAFDFIAIGSHDFRDTPFETTSRDRLFTFHFAQGSSFTR